MAIEPIGSIMSTQATGYVAPKPSSTPVETTEYTPQSIEPANKIDATTTVVENAEAKGDANQGTDSQGNQTAYPSNEQLKKALEKINKSTLYNAEAVFGIHEGTNRVTIKLVDKDSKEIIKELPAEKTLDMIARVWEMAGILVDEKR